MKNIFTFFLAMIAFITSQAVPAQTIKDVAYGKDPQQKMDVYLPEGRTSSTPVLVLIHGGAWVNGDKADFLPYVDTFQKRFPDYAIFNINYRLVTFSYTNLYPTQENDVKQAIEFIYGKRSEYIISDKFILLGASAGSNLAMLQAYKQTQPVRAKAVIDFFGPTDMKAMYQSVPVNIRSALEIFMNGTPASNPANYNNASPVNFVTTQSPPTLILYGGRDRMIPAAQHTLLKEKLEQSGVPNKTVFYPSYGHGWYGERLSDSFDQIAAFLNTLRNT
jgi:acetyl esterase/lipase